MDPSNELLCVVDENNQPIKSEARDIVHNLKLWHRTTAIWIVNRERQILCQQRSTNKDVNPGMWEACFGGHVGACETVCENCVVELREELEVVIEESQLIHFKIFKNDKPNHKTFQYAYMVVVDNKEFEIQTEELEQVKWMSIEEVLSVLNKEDENGWLKRSSDIETIEWVKTKLANNV
jgi:isopentenyldiphosphate isomerase